MNDDSIETVRGSGNLFRDFGYPDADVRQAKALLYQVAKVPTLDRALLVMAGAGPPSTTLSITAVKVVDGAPPAYAGACFAHHDAIRPPMGQP